MMRKLDCTKTIHKVRELIKYFYCNLRIESSALDNCLYDQ